MMKNPKFAFIGVLFLLVFSAPSFSQAVYLKGDSAKDEAVKKSDALDEEITEAQQEAEAAWNEKLMGVIGDASIEERQHFYLVYSNYNIIKATDIVVKDVERAVKACAENNPDMKSNLAKRYREWSKSVNSVLEEAKANVKNMVIAQDYAEPKKIEEVFLMADKVRDLANEKSEKVPVTSQSACEYLLKTMDNTQANLEKTLKETLVSVPQAFQKQAQ